MELKSTLNRLFSKGFKPFNGFDLKSGLSLFLFLVFGLFLILPASAGDIEDSSLEDLLMETEESVSGSVVVGASKKMESIGNSPSIVTVITRSQIDKLHVRNLYELISYVTGAELNESYFGFTTANFRGLLQNIYNSKILIVINGHSVFESVNGNASFEMIPIHAIKKIEVIRGPGSVLYGTNAFAGLINITTMDGEGYEKNMVKATMGSFGFREIGFNGYSRHGMKGSLFFSGTVQEDNGWDYHLTADEQAKSGTIPYVDKVNNLYLNYKRNALTFQAGHFALNKTKFGITPVFAYTGINDIKGTMFDLTWDWKVSERNKAKLSFRKDIYTRDMDLGYFPARPFAGYDSQVRIDSDSDGFSTEFQFERQMNDKWHYIAGFLYEEFHSDPYLFLWNIDGSTHPLSAYVQGHDSSNKAFYTQFDFQPSRKLNLLAAVRINDNSLSGRSTVPRFGAVYELDKDFYMKVLYGKAYRNASFFERYVSTFNVLFGDSTLKDETIEQWDLAFDKKLGELTLRLNFFRATTDELIGRVATNDPVRTGPKSSIYTNIQGQEIEGVEFELRGNINPRLETFLNMASRRGHNLADGSNIQNFAKFIGNLHFNYDMGNGWSWNNQLQYLGSRQVLPSVTLYNTSLDYALPKGLTFSLVVKNAFDKEYLDPEYNRGVIPALPGGPGRAIYLQASKEF